MIKKNQSLDSIYEDDRRSYEEEEADIAADKRLSRNHAIKQTKDASHSISLNDTKVIRKKSSKQSASYYVSQDKKLDDSSNAYKEERLSEVRYKLNRDQVKSKENISRRNSKNTLRSNNSRIR